MLTLCAILLPRATAKVSAPLTPLSAEVLLPHFVLHFRTGRVIHRTVSLASLTHENRGNEDAACVV
jgi:hypothetical protein